MVDTSNSRLANNFNATAEKMNEFFLGTKNHIAKNLELLVTKDFLNQT